MWIFWLILLIATLVLEAVTFNMVSLWFAFGALGALLADLYSLELAWQIIIFITVSAFGLLLFVLIFKPRREKETVVRTNADRIIGEEALVIVGIESPEKPGVIRVLGQEWSAIPTVRGLSFAEGQMVKVLQIKGVKALVEAIPEAIPKEE